MMQPDGVAVVYCDGAFGTPNGKTAHGLVRQTARYTVAAVIDARHAGKLAAEVLEGVSRSIPITATLEQALETARAQGTPATHFVIGLAPDGGRLPTEGWAVVRAALQAGLHVDSGLHDFISDRPEMAALAAAKGVRIRDVRKPPSRDELHFFSGKIEEVESFRVAVLGTDSAVGKRTTAWFLVNEFNRRGIAAEMIGTGQTAWMQGVRFGMVLDSLINDFVSGEIEHAVWSAWHETQAKVLILEGQGSVLNPAYPGGYELLAAGRPHAIVVQHAPSRVEYDGFPGYPMDSLERQIQVLELISRKPVVAVTINNEGLDAAGVESACAAIEASTGLPAVNVLTHGAGRIVDAIDAHRRQFVTS